MPARYLARLLIWAALIIGFIWAPIAWLAEGPIFMESGETAAERNARDRVNRLVRAGQIDPEDLETTRRPPIRLFPLLSRYVNRPVAWMRENWVFLTEAIVLIGLGWGAIGHGLGVYDLVFADLRWVRFVNGLVAGLMFGNMLFVAYLTTHHTIPWTVEMEWTLFPVAIEGPHPGEAIAVRRVGHFLLETWLPLLMVLYIPAARRYRQSSWRDRWPAFGLGLLASVGLTVILVEVAWHSTPYFSQTIEQWRAWFAMSPAAAEGRVDADQPPLHLFGLLITLTPLLGMILAGTIAYAGRIACPVWIVCLFCWLFNSVYGFVSLHFAGMQYVLLAFGIAVGVVANARHPFKLSLPNMDPEYRAAREGTAIVRLAGGEDTEPTLPLIGGEELLAQFCEQWQREQGTDTKPRLVVVAASGGGIRAVVWTATVLEGLERIIGPGFGRHTRLMAGASGGMVAAGLYAAQKVRPIRGLSLSQVLAEDSLWPTIQTLVLRDLPSVFLPFHRDWDRGRSLEQAWHRNIRPAELGQVSPFQTTFAELHEAERQGRAPSLIYSPLMVEDARRLLISNLDLKDLIQESAPTLVASKTGEVQCPRTILSRSGVEFFRLFPTAHARFEVGTAARLSATFPYVSPGVSLPTLPPRRIVDAGYFDNYGVNLLGEWLYKHREAVQRYCSGVALVEIRGFPLEFEKTTFAWAGCEGEETPNSLTTALAGMSTPAEALVNIRSAGAYYRNDQLLGILDQVYNRDPDDPFLVRIPFECPGAAALSWTLTRRDRDFIIGHFDQAHAGTDALAGWFGLGGR